MAEMPAKTKNDYQNVHLILDALKRRDLEPALRWELVWSLQQSSLVTELEEVPIISTCLWKWLRGFASWSHHAIFHQ